MSGCLARPGRGCFESSAAAKHVCAELKSRHMFYIKRAREAERPRDRARDPPDLLPEHNLDAQYIERVPDLRLPTASEAASRSHQALTCLKINALPPPLEPEKHVANQLQDAEASGSAGATAALRRLSSDVVMLDQPHLASRLSESMGAACQEPPLKRSRSNGWVLFWKEKESQAAHRPGETNNQRRLRILEEARHEWSASCPALLQIFNF